MRKWLLSIAGLMIAVSFVFADDFETPHRFKPGDVISADVMNEIFDYIESSKKTVSALDLVGEWKCSKSRIAAPHENQSGNYDWISPGYQWSTNKLFMSTNDLRFVISVDAEGNLKWNSTPRNAISSICNVDDGHGNPSGRACDGCSGNGSIDPMSGYLAVSSNNCLQDLSNYSGFSMYTYSVDIARVSKTRVKMTWSVPIVLLCDLQKVPPKSPDIIATEFSGPAITLTWRDNSGDESLFKIMRKNDLNGSYAVIGTASANSTTFFDVVPAVGTYWYRVVASNGNGDSLGSNVVMIRVERLR